MYEQCAAPLVRAVAQHGIGTLFMYGQTGSGKTHTMSGLEEGVASELAALLHPAGGGRLTAGEVTVRLRYFELVGKRCVDLIGKQPGIELKLMNDGNDAVRPQGAAEPIVEGARAPFPARDAPFPRP